MELKGFGVMRNRAGLSGLSKDHFPLDLNEIEYRIADKRMRLNSFSRSILVAFRPNYLTL